MIRLCPGLKPGVILLPVELKLPGFPPDERLKSLAALDPAKIVLDQMRYPKGRNWIRGERVDEWVKGKKKLIPLSTRERDALATGFDQFARHLNPRVRGSDGYAGGKILFWITPQVPDDYSEAPRAATMFHRPEEYENPESRYFLETESADARATILKEELIAFLEP